MLKIEKYEKINNINEIVFKVVYAIHLILAFNVFTTQSKYTLPVVVLTAVIVLIYRIIKIKKYIGYTGLNLLLFFMVSYIITTLLNIKYGWLESFQTFIWMFLQFVILYTFDVEKNRNDVYKEFCIVSKIILVVISLINLTSVIMVFNEYSSTVLDINGSAHIIGISKWGRLFGLYTDPNYAGILSVVLIFIAIYFIKVSKRNIGKVLYGITIIIQYLFIVFSGSRSSLLSLILGLIVFLLFMCFSLENKKILNRLVKSFALSCLTVITILSTSNGIIRLYNNIIAKEKVVNTIDKNEIVIDNKTNTIINDNSISIEENSINSELEEDNTLNQEKNSEEKNDDSSETIKIGREEKINEDISNRRFDIWKSSIEIFLTSPVYGVGFENLIEYAKEKLPNTYIVNNDYTNFDASHNMIIDVLVGQGIIGIICIIGFAITISILFMKNIKVAIKEDRNLIITLISICSVLIVSSLFLSQILYINIITTYLFWLYLGYLMYFLQKRNIKEEKLND